MSWSVGGVCTLSDGLTANWWSVDTGCVGLCGCCGGGCGVGVVVEYWCF